MTPIGTWIQTPNGSQLRTPCSLESGLLSVRFCEFIVRQTVHGPVLSWGSWLSSPTVTQLQPGRNHARKWGTWLRIVEGHVPKGVEVQVLSSAHQQLHIQFKQETMCRYIGRIGTWFFLCTER